MYETKKEKCLRVNVYAEPEKRFLNGGPNGIEPWGNRERCQDDCTVVLNVYTKCEEVNVYAECE